MERSVAQIACGVHIAAEPQKIPDILSDAPKGCSVQ
jgi:hypothetical protein